ncbi:MAG: PQQ-like beta-propeller repeat protein, partial [Planctomycetes bacterium]|nr:PQQ-like beta-propeller repeat protein [Planctomycetota bacterium]
HTLASVSSVVSFGGRLFYIADEAPSASIRIPSRWFLIARDGFNGVLLWKRPIDSWADHLRRFRSGPVQLPRLLVAWGDRVYLPLGIDAPVSALDAATGKTVRTYDPTGGAEEIIVHDGVLLVVTGEPVPEQALAVPTRRGKARVPFPNRKTVVALDTASGQLLWKWQEDDHPVVPLTLAAAVRRSALPPGRTSCVWTCDPVARDGGGRAALCRPINPDPRHRQTNRPRNRGKTTDRRRAKAARGDEKPTRFVLWVGRWRRWSSRAIWFYTPMAGA